MALTCTYDASLGRVRVTATGLGAALVATVQRSTNGVTWTTVRGGTDVPVVAGALARTVDDYEFADGVLTTYRVRYRGTITFVAAGAAAHGNAVSVSPGLPAGLATGDRMLMVAAIRNSGAGAPVTPAGWTLHVDLGNFRLYSKVAGPGEVAPTVTFSGGVVNATTSAQIAAWRGAPSVPAAVGQSNASAQNVAYAGITPAGDNCAVVVAGWKQDDWTSVATLAGMTEIGEPSSTLGDDQGLVWDYVIQTAAAAVPAGVFVVTGGAGAVSSALAVTLDPGLLTQTNTITPALGTVWLKFAGKPFLNRPVTVIGWSDVTRQARSGLFLPRGRSLPVAVTEVRGPRTWSMDLMTDTAAQADELDLILSGGDVTLVHVPAGGAVPAGWAHVSTVSIGRRSNRGLRRYVTLGLTECAAPVASIVGSTAAYQTVKTTYATYGDVATAHASYASVLELIAAPSEVVAP